MGGAVAGSSDGSRWCVRFGCLRACTRAHVFVRVATVAGVQRQCVQQLQPIVELPYLSSRVSGRIIPSSTLDLPIHDTYSVHALRGIQSLAGPPAAMPQGLNTCGACCAQLLLVHTISIVLLYHAKQRCATVVFGIVLAAIVAG